MADSPGATAPPEGRRAALSRELSEFLIELSIGVHRFSMYPANHPSLGPVVESIVVAVAGLFEDREQLSIGVANRQLVIEGVATDRKHPVLGDLARRLHDQQLGAVSFEFGVRAQEVNGFLRTMAQAADEEREPLGLLGDALPTWPHITLHPLGYDSLRIREGDAGAGGEGEVTQLWIGLARAALAGREGEGGPAGLTDDPDAADPALLAREISKRGKDTAYDQVIVGYLRQLAGQLRDADSREAERIRSRVTELVREMDEPTLRRLVELGGDGTARRKFVLDANQGLAVDAVVKVVKAASQASGQTISSSMTRLLSKLAAHADDGSRRVRAQANSALRENVEQLIEDWELKDPNPDQYTRVLDSMAHASPIFENRGPAGADTGVRGEDELPGAMRVVQMAIEVDAWGETVRTAIHDLTQLRMTGELLALLERAGPENRLAGRIREILTDPDQIRRFLSGTDVDEEALAALVASMGEAAVPPLMDVMATSESRSVRRAVFDELAGLGTAAGAEAARRLAGESRWFVLRNLIALAARLPEVPEGIEVLPLLSHDEARVRREALPLAFRVPAVRSRALAAGLADPDERICRMALHELRDGVPQTLLPTLINRVVKSDRPEDLRAAAVRTLGGVEGRLVRETLLELVIVGKSFLGKPKLADPAPPVLAALRVLADGWSDDDEAASVLEAAKRSKELQLQRAAEGSGR